MVKVLVTPRSFGTYSKLPYELLEKEGIEIVQNPEKGILSKEALSDLVRDVDGIIAGVDQFDKEVLKNAKKLVAVSKYGVGVDNIDVAYCNEHNIEVMRAVGANSSAVSDYTFALILGVSRRICEIDAGCRSDDWSKKTAHDIYGKKLGVIGMGNIGKGVVLRASGFNMEVMGYDPYWDEAFAKEHNVTECDVDTIMKECDFVTLHLPLSEDTHHLISKERIDSMKSNAVLVNTARGGLVDEAALFEALSNRRIFGAGLDVFETEPAKDTPFKALDNVILGSHCAASTEGAVDQMGIIATQNLIASLKKRGVING